MSEVKLKPTGGGSGSISLKAPTATTGGADFPLVLPADDGTASQYLQTNGSGTLSWATVSSGATINNATANELVTVASTTTQLDAEANLTFDGSTLQVTGDIQGAGNDGTANALKWDKSDDTLYFRDDYKAKFGTGGDLEIFHNATNGNKIMSNNMDIRIGTHNNHTLILGQYYNAAGGGDTCEIWSSGVMPAVNDDKDLGETNHKWDDIYATNSTIQTSDRNDKENITASDLGLSFINKLSPKSYKFKGKTRTHYGLVSQDVETVLGDISKPTSGFAGFIKTDSSEAKDGSSYNYGLRYGEFIGPLVKAVQELSAEVETLKTKVAALEAG